MRPAALVLCLSAALVPLLAAAPASAQGFRRNLNCEVVFAQGLDATIFGSQILPDQWFIVVSHGWNTTLPAGTAVTYTFKGQRRTVSTGKPLPPAEKMPVSLAPSAGPAGCSATIPGKFAGSKSFRAPPSMSRSSGGTQAPSAAPR